MATNIRLKSSSISNRVPTLSDLSLRELAINTTDGRLFLRKGNGTGSDVIVDLTDHGSFYGLADDDHTQYLHSTITRTGVTAELNTTGKITTTASIGIGTANPVQKLTIVNAAKSLADGSLFALSSSDATNAFQLLISRTAAGSGSCYAIQSVEQNVDFRNLSLNPNGGNVGIGITNPESKTHIAVTSVGVVTALTLDNTNGAAVGADFKVNYGGYATSRIVFDFVGGQFGSLSHGMNYVSGRTNFSNHWFRNASNATQMVMNNAGNLLIGTETDSGTATQRLQVTGGAYVSGFVGIGNTNPSTILGLNTTGTISWGSSGYSFIQGTDSISSYLRFGVSGSESLRITSTGVGIGTTNPQNLLELRKDTAAFRQSSVGESGGYISTFGLNWSTTNTFIIDVNPTGASATRIFNYGSDGNLTLNYASTSTSRAFIITDGASERLRVNSSGNVGIGTTNPAGKFQVSSSNDQVRIECSAGTGGATYTALSRTLQLSCSQDNSGAFTTYSDIVANSTQFNENALRFFTHENGVVAPQERVRITGAGNVGIGNSSPATRLHVLSSISSLPSADDTTTAVGYFGNTYINTTNGTSAYTVLRLQRSGEAGITYPSTADFSIARYEASGTASRTRLDIRLGHQATNTTDTTVMSLLSSGNVGIGTTNPATKLEIAGTSPTLRITGNAGSSATLDLSSTAAIKWTIVGNPTGSSGALSFQVNDSEQLRVSSTGNLGIATTNPLGKLSIYTTSINGATDYNGQNFGIIVGKDGGDVLNEEGNGIVFTQQYTNDGVDSSQVRTGAIVGYKGQATGNFGGGLKFKVQPTGAVPMVDAMVLTKDGNLGIGSSTPQYDLHLGGDAVGDATGQIALGSITNAPSARIDGYRVDGTFRGELHLYTTNSGGTQNRAVTIDSVQNVGIGTTNPQGKLHVQSGALIVNNGAAGSISVGLQLFSNVVGNVDGSGQRIEFRSDTLNGYIEGVRDFAAGPAVSMRLGTVFGEAIRIIGSTSNVGIGTTNPESRTHIYAPSQNSNTELLRLSGGNRTADSFETGFRISTETTSANSNRHLRLICNGQNGFSFQPFETSTGNVAIDRSILVCPSGGNVGVGTTNPSTRLHVSGDVRIADRTTASLFISRSSNSVTAQHFYTPSNDSPWYLFGENLTWTGERIGTTRRAEKPYYEAFSPALGIKEFGFVNKTSADTSFIATDLVQSLVLKNNGNVGIGTTNPSELLDVNGRTVIKTGIAPFYALKLSDYSDTTGLYLGSVSGGTSRYIGDAYYYNSGLWRTDKTTASYINFINGHIEFYSNTGLTANTDYTPSRKMILDTSGFLLINRSAATGTASQNLQVEGGAYISGNVGIGITNPSNKVHIYSASGTSRVQIDSGSNNSFVGYDGSTNDLQLASSTNIKLQTGASYTEAVRITSTGNVGIGITNPSNKLHVSGNARIDGNTNPYLVLNDGTNTGYFQIASGLLDLNHDGDITFSPGGSQKVRIKSTGNVGIGTTNPADKLDVNGNVIPTTDATHNLGSPTKRWNNVYTTDLQLSNEGSHNDVDGTWGAYTIQEGEEDLFLINRRNGKKYKFVLQEVN